MNDPTTNEDEQPQDTRVDEERGSSFADLQDEQHLSLAAEFWQFLRYNKKWWLTPILLTLAVLGLLVALTATGAAPFIYPF